MFARPIIRTASQLKQINLSKIMGKRSTTSASHNHLRHGPPPPHPPGPQPSPAGGAFGGGAAGVGAEAGASAGTKPKSGFWSLVIRRGIRAVQIGVLCVTIYQYGYQSGVLAYMKNHEEMDQMYIDLAMERKGIDAVEPSEDVVRVANQNLRRVRSIVSRLLTAAQELADEEARKAIELYTHEGSTENKDKAEQWIEAKKTVSGNWQVILLKNPSVNAYVSSLCPKKIFVFAGLIQVLNPTDDELAMVLAHELSHAMMGHGGELDMWIHSFYIILQLIFITLIDPTGFHVFAFDIGANSLRKMLEASFSRDHENEADELGLRIAQRACFHGEHGVEVMKKLADLQKLHEDTKDYHKTTMFDDHPASIERYEHLLELYKQLPEEEKNRCKPIFQSMQEAAPTLWRSIFG